MLRGFVVWCVFFSCASVAHTTFSRLTQSVLGPVENALVVNTQAVPFQECSKHVLRWFLLLDWWVGGPSSFVVFHVPWSEWGFHLPLSNNGKSELHALLSMWNETELSGRLSEWLCRSGWD